MAKKSGGKGNIMGAVGGILIGAAILLFVCTVLINAVKGINSFGSVDLSGGHGAGHTPAQNATWNQSVLNKAAWNASNVTFNQLKTFLTVIVILLAILGIVIIGATIISSIGGAFGG